MALFFLVGLALLAGFLFIFFTSLLDKKRTTPVGNPADTLSETAFKRVCIDLVGVMKLEIEEQEIQKDQIDIVARNPAPFTGGLLLVRGVYAVTDRSLTATQVIQFSNMILQERVTKGILITSGRFPEELGGIAELAPIEFIDGERLRLLVTQHGIPTSIS